MESTMQNPPLNLVNWSDWPPILPDDPLFYYCWFLDEKVQAAQITLFDYQSSLSSQNPILLYRARAFVHAMGGVDMLLVLMKSKKGSFKEPIGGKLTQAYRKRRAMLKNYNEARGAIEHSLDWELEKPRGDQHYVSNLDNNTLVVNADVSQGVLIRPQIKAEISPQNLRRVLELRNEIVAATIEAYK
jgi:hypothetical protein